MENNVISLAEYNTKKEIKEYNELKDYVQRIMDSLGGVPDPQPFIVLGPDDPILNNDLDKILNQLMDIQVKLDIMGYRRAADSIGDIVGGIMGVNEGD